MSQTLSTLLQNGDVWQARRGAPASANRLDTGYTHLNQALGGGWHPHALTEINTPQSGIGEFSLLIPALVRLSAIHATARQNTNQYAGRWIVLVAPPYIPYAPAIRHYGLDPAQFLLVQPRREQLWAVEQALRSGTCAAVLSWPQRADARSLRRLQLAAEAGRSWGVLFRPSNCLDTRSPAAIRLRLTPDVNTTRIDVVKCRGQKPVHGIQLPLGPFAEHALRNTPAAGIATHRQRLPRCLVVSPRTPPPAFHGTALRRH